MKGVTTGANGADILSLLHRILANGAILGTRCCKTAHERVGAHVFCGGANVHGLHVIETIGGQKVVGSEQGGHYIGESVGVGRGLEEGGGPIGEKDGHAIRGASPNRGSEVLGRGPGILWIQEGA